MFLPAAGFLLAFILCAVHVYVGFAFWRLHRDDFTRLSVYILTHQAGLIANFAKGRPRLLRFSNALALDALSFPRLLKVFLAWPWYVFRYRDVLEFARYSSRVLGDERTDALSERLESIGLPRADRDDVKSSDRFVEGFLVRRLDEELVAVFWHETHSAGGEGSHHTEPLGTRKIVPFRVPGERRVKFIAQAFGRWGLYSHVVEGQARARNGRSLPYVVVFEPFTLGTKPSVGAFTALARDDLYSLGARFIGNPTRALTREFAFEDETDEGISRDLRAERAYRRFLLAIQSRS